MITRFSVLRHLRTACCALTLCSSAVTADEVHVAVAANFAPTLEAIAADFETNSPHRVIVSRGSTGKLYAQIVNGAPYDLYFAADSERPRLLEETGHAAQGTRFTYAVGRLVLWSPDPQLIDATNSPVEVGSMRFLAVANQRLAPYGAAAAEVLAALGAQADIVRFAGGAQPDLVLGENIQQALQFVVSGNAGAGLIARASLVRGKLLTTGSAWLVPASMHAPIEQQAVILRQSVAADELLRHLGSQAGRALILADGYALPD